MWSIGAKYQNPKFKWAEIKNHAFHDNYGITEVSVQVTYNDTRWVPVRCDGSKKNYMKHRNETTNITMICKIRVVNIIIITNYF
jgi:formylmethanofuran dehydrogenase subunit E